jgi:AraC-like DNA-binding protein
MKFAEFPPSPALTKYLEVIWCVSDEAGASEAPPERVLPDGCIEWIFHLATPFQRQLDRGFELQQRSFVVGELTQFILVQPTGPTLTMGVRFRPGGAYRFMPTPLNLLTDETVSTEDVWGNEGKYLEAAVLGEPSQLGRQRLIEAFLLARLHRTAARPRFEAAVKQIVASRGQSRVDHVAGSIGMSSRQLEREFRTSAGISPKALARIIRFQNLMRMVGESDLRDWVGLAIASGYADQPHMVREFREFCGQSPTEHQANSFGKLASHFVSPHRLAALLGKA